MAEFEAAVRTSLRSINSSAAALTSGLERMQRTGQAAMAGAAGVFDKYKKGAESAGKSSEGLGKSIATMGQAAARAGGPLGEIIGRITGGAGMSAGFARLAVAAGLASFAFRAFSSAVGANIERTKKLIEAQKELRDIKTQAARDVASQGIGAVSSQGQGLRLLESRGGQQAIDEANEIARSGVASTADAQAGVAQSLKIKDERARKAVVEAGKRVASSGELGFSDFVSRAAASRADQSRLLRTQGTSEFDRAAARVVLSASGDPASASSISVTAGSIAAGATQRGLISPINRTQGLINQRDEVGQQRIASGAAEGEARRLLAAERSPETAAMVELFKRQQQSDEDMRKLIESQGKIMAALKDAMMLFGGEGSYRQQLRRELIARGQAYGEGG